MAAFRFRVPESMQGERLDRIVALSVEGLSRSGARRLLDAGRVRVEGLAREADYHPPAGALVEGDTVEPAPSTLCPEPFEVEVLFEDEFLLVLNKPVGLTVHPGAGRREGTLVHQLLGSGRALSSVGGPERPGIVHRLDRDTSGCILVARTDAAHHALSAQFRTRRTEKEYRALVWGVPRRPRGRLEAPIGRHPVNRRLMSTRSRAGRPALTEYRLLSSALGVAWLGIDLRTGRTHQIRVHLAALGHPVVGDVLYGAAPQRVSEEVRSALASCPRLMLHAWRLVFEHPARGERVEVHAPLPPELEDLLRTLGLGD